MVLSVRLTEDQYTDWKNIASISQDDWRNAYNALTSPKDILFSGPDFSNALSSAGVPEISALSLVRQILAIRQLARDSHFGINTACEAVGVALKARVDAIPGDLESRLRDFEKIINSESAAIASKTHALSSDHDNVLISSYMVTDTRPIFDGARSEIVGSIIINYLKLEVYEHGNRRNVSYVLDEADIDKLIEQLRDIKKKTKNVAQLYREKLGIRTFVVGDDSFGTDAK